MKTEIKKKQTRIPKEDYINNVRYFLKTAYYTEITKDLINKKDSIKVGKIYSEAYSNLILLLETRGQNCSTCEMRSIGDIITLKRLLCLLKQGELTLAYEIYIDHF